MVDLPLDFVARMKTALKDEAELFFRSYENPPVRAVRVNTLKVSAEQFEKISPVELGDRVAWCQQGYYADGDNLGKTFLHAAGAYYVQEPSAMCAAPELEVCAGERVLDLCAAPGGKSTQIAQYMQGKGVLVLNEIDGARCEILRGNAERMGVSNAIITCAAPENLAKVCENYFDKILVDAPCSGEGMFKKEENAIPEWSLANVTRCAQRQAHILECADRMLAGGGRLVYSTCTFSREEDEGQIEEFLRRHKNYKLIKMKKLMPHEVRGEGHFCAVLQKERGERAQLKTRQKTEKGGLLNLYREWEAQTLKIRIENIYGKDKLYYFCDGAPVTDDWQKAGVAVRGGGVILNRCDVAGRFEPSHMLAMCLKAEQAKCVEVDEQTAQCYLRGLTFACGEENGWRLVTYKNLPLGWCKVVNGTAKNHLPKGLRI